MAPTEARGWLRAGDVLAYQGKRRFKVIHRQSTTGREAPQARDKTGWRICTFYVVTVEPMDDKPLPGYMQSHHVKGDPPRSFRISDAHFFVFHDGGRSGWKLTTTKGQVQQ